MDTTPGEFHWALAPSADLAAWSSNRDREAVRSIRQRRLEMDKPTLTEAYFSRLVPGRTTATILQAYNNVGLVC